MPCEYRIFEDQNLLVTTYSGRVTYRCVLDVLDRIEADPQYRDGMSELVDLRAITDLAINEDEIAKLADLIVGIYTRRQGHTRKVTVASDGEILAVAKAFQEALDGMNDLEFGIASTLNEALYFLGLDYNWLEKAVDRGPKNLH